MPAILPTLLFFPSPSNLGVVGTSAAINQAGDYASMICRVPQTGTVTGIKFGTGTVTTGCVIEGRIETVTAGVPDNALYDANATGTVTVANTDDNTTKTVTFAGNVSVTKNDCIAIVLRISSGTPSNLAIRTYSTLIISASPFLYKVETGVTTTSATPPSMVLTYDTGDVAIIGTLPGTGATNVTLSTTTSPDEAGNKITMPYTARSNGCIFRSAASPQACDVVLYDSSDNVVASMSLDPDSLVIAGGQNFAYWTTPVDLLRGRTYRLVLKPTTSTSWTNALQYVNGIIAQPTSIATYVSATHRTDAGAWTDTADRYYNLCLMFDRLYQSGGSYF